MFCGLRGSAERGRYCALITSANTILKHDNTSVLCSTSTARVQYSITLLAIHYQAWTRAGVERVYEFCCTRTRHEHSTSTVRVQEHSNVLRVCLVSGVTRYNTTVLYVGNPGILLPGLLARPPQTTKETQQKGLANGVGRTSTYEFGIRNPITDFKHFQLHPETTYRRCSKIK